MRQRGFGTVEIVLVLLLVGMGAGVVWTYNSAIVRAERAEADNATLRQANDEALAENQQLRMFKAQQDKILAERQGRRNAAAEIERKIDATLANVYQQNEAARTWGATPVPQSVLDSVRAESSRQGHENGKVPAGGKPAGP